MARGNRRHCEGWEEVTPTKVVLLFPKRASWPIHHFWSIIDYWPKRFPDWLERQLQHLLPYSSVIRLRPSRYGRKKPSVWKEGVGNKEEGQGDQLLTLQQSDEGATERLRWTLRPTSCTLSFSWQTRASTWLTRRWPESFGPDGPRKRRLRCRSPLGGYIPSGQFAFIVQAG